MQKEATLNLIDSKCSYETLRLTKEHCLHMGTPLALGLHIYRQAFLERPAPNSAPVFGPTQGQTYFDSANNFLTQKDWGEMVKEYNVTFCTVCLSMCITL